MSYGEYDDDSDDLLLLKGESVWNLISRGTIVKDLKLRRTYIVILLIEVVQ